MSDLLSTRHDDGNTTNQTDVSKNESCYGYCYFQVYTGIDVTVITNCVLNVPSMVISTLGNALVLAAIIRTPSIRSNSIIILSSLAVSDFLVSIVAQPLYIARGLTKNNVFLFHLSQMSMVSLCGVSLSTITAITLDRFLALNFHMRYAGLVTKFRVTCVLLMIWLFNVFLSCVQIWSDRAYLLVTAVFTCSCLIISTFCYIRIFRIVRHHQLQINAQQQAVQSSNLNNNLNITRLSRSAKNTFVFYIVLILCYCPIFVLMVFYGSLFMSWKTEWHFAATVMFMNSSINPALYCWRLRELRTAVRKTARQMLCTQTVQE